MPAPPSRPHMVQPPSVGRYLLGLCVMLLGVILPLFVAATHTLKRGSSLTRADGCVL